MALEQWTEVEKDPHEGGRAGAVEQGRFQRNIYLRVIGMWQRRRQEAASWSQYRREEEGLEALPSRRSLGENGTAADRDVRATLGLLPRLCRQRELCTYTPAPAEVVWLDL